MGESEHHAELVTLIADWVRTTHASNSGLSLLVDSRSLPAGRRPGQISGFTPDVICRTTPASFVIIGEAKSFNDFFTPRTTLQLTAFMDYLSLQSDPLLVFATPLAARGAAGSLVRRIQRSIGARTIPTVFLCG